MSRRIDELEMGMSATRAAIDTILMHNISKSPIPVSCMKGCSYCCQIFCGCSGIEAVLIAHKWLEFPDWKAMGRELGKVARKMSADGATHSSYAAQQIDCPFLDKKERTCRVYAVRPSACRFHFSVDLPERCKADSPKGMKHLDTNHFRRGHEMAEMMYVRDAADREVGPLPLMVLWAAQRLTDDKAKLKLLKTYRRGLPQPVEWMQMAMEDGGLLKQAALEIAPGIDVDENTRFEPRTCTECGDNFLAYEDETLCIDCGGVPSPAEEVQPMLELVDREET